MNRSQDQTSLDVDVLVCFGSQAIEGLIDGDSNDDAEGGINSGDVDGAARMIMNPLIRLGSRKG